MVDYYHVFPDNLSFLSFLKLTKATRRMNESVKRTPKPSLVSRPNPMVRQIARNVIAVEKSQEGRYSNFKEPSY